MAEFEDDGPRYSSGRNRQYSRAGKGQTTYSTTGARPPAPATTDHLRARSLGWWLSPGVSVPLAGFPVTLSWSVLAFALLPFGWWVLGMGSLVGVGLWLVAAVLSVLVHEMGHGFAARRFGLGPVQITVHGIGGFCVHRATPEPYERLAISLAGPAAGLTVVGIAWGLTGIPALAQGVAVMAFLNGLIWIGLVWSGFNLLPIVPLDGGNALAAWLKSWMPGLAMPVVWGVGAVTAVICTVLAIVVGEYFLTVLTAYFAYENGRALWRWRNADRPSRRR